MPAFLKRAVPWCFYVILACILPVSASPDSPLPEIIKVGAYNFPPIATVDENNQARGLLGDLLQTLEENHADITFQVIHTSPRRRHMDFKSGLFDVMFFENPDWSWNPEAIDVSAPILRDEEVYVALAKPGRDQSFFKDVDQQRIIAIAGYHYGFAGQETDGKILRNRFRIELSHSYRRNLELIRADRPSLAEVAVISRSFLNTYFSRFPDERDTFLVSTRLDQSYELRIIVRKNGPVSVEQVENLIRPLIDNGHYQAMVRRHGLKLPDSLLESP